MPAGKPILYIVVFICQSQSPNSTHLSFPTQCPYTCSPHLCLHFCFANRFIYTIFLDSTYMLIYKVFLSDISLCMTVCRSIHVSADGTISFLFHDQVIFHCTYAPHLLHPFICQHNRHLGYFRVLAIVNSATNNTGVHVSFQAMLFCWYMTRSGVAGLW